VIYFIHIFTEQSYFFFVLSLLVAAAAAAVHVENENCIQGKYMRLRANLLPHVWAAD
jgi:hypothetical protein